MELDLNLFLRTVHRGDFLNSKKLKPESIKIYGVYVIN